MSKTNKPLKKSVCLFTLSNLWMDPIDKASRYNRPVKKVGRNVNLIPNDRTQIDKLSRVIEYIPSTNDI